MLVFRRALFFGLRMRTPDVVCGLPLAANATRARRRKAAAVTMQAAAAKADSGKGCRGGVVADAAMANGLENASCLGPARAALSTPMPRGLGEAHANAALLGHLDNWPPRHHIKPRTAMSPVARGDMAARRMDKC